MIYPKSDRPRLEAICELVAAAYDLAPADLKTRTNAHEISHPRQLAMYIAWSYLHWSLPRIGRAFGMHHTTVLHGIRRVEAALLKESQIEDLVYEIERQLKAGEVERKRQAPTVRLSRLDRLEAIVAELVRQRGVA